MPRTRFSVLACALGAAAATCVAVAGTPAFAAGTSTPPQLEGMWQYTDSDGMVQHLLIDASSIRIFVSGNDQAVGRLSVSGSIITLYPTNRCDDTGTYQWSVQGGTLTFALLGKDSCRRSTLLPSVSWTRP